MQTQPANNPNHIPTATNRIRSILLKRDRSPSLQPTNGSIPVLPYQFPSACTPIGPKLSNCSTSTWWGPAVSSVISGVPAICCRPCHLPGLQRLLIRIELRLVPHVDLF